MQSNLVKKLTFFGKAIPISAILFLIHTNCYADELSAPISTVVHALRSPAQAASQPSDTQTSQMAQPSTSTQAGATAQPATSAPAGATAQSAVNTQAGTTAQSTTNAEAGMPNKVAPASQAEANPNATNAAKTTTNSAVAQTTEAAPDTDPYENFNRAMFTFNDKLDIYLLKPVATLYTKIMPKPLYKGIHNFFNNIAEFPIIANDILQLHFYQMASDMWRLGINTTIGIGGLFDVAKQIKLEYYPNDFGLTMAVWGYKNSDYLVLPFFGPNTIRDGIGIPVDYFAFSIYPYVNPESFRYELYGLGVVDRRAQLLHYQSVMEEAAVDKYIFMRNAYMQRRNYQIEKNQYLGYKDRETMNQAPLPPQANYNGA